MCLNFDSVITANGSLWGMVCDGVLVADIAGNFGGDRIDILERARKKGNSSCLTRERLKVALSMSGFAATKHESYGVDNGPLRVLNTMNCLIQGELRGVVITIGNHNQHLPGPRR